MIISKGAAMYLTQMCMASVVTIIFLLSGCEKECHTKCEMNADYSKTHKSLQKNKDHPIATAPQEGSEKNKQVIEALKKVVAQLDSLQQEHNLLELGNFRIECHKHGNDYHFSIIPLPAAPDFKNTIIVKEKGEVVVIPW